ncbi:ATP-grasp domain-containing protein, partial [Vibrio cholerae O1]|nr:ATP-grasp domain-containing protein [Vibrio cholerae O1]
FEKEFLTNEAKVNVAPWQLVDSAEKLPETVTRKQVLKTTTGGYDGHGQVVLNTDEKLSAAKSLTELSECVLEDFIS